MILSYICVYLLGQYYYFYYKDSLSLPFHEITIIHSVIKYFARLTYLFISKLYVFSLVLFIATQENH